jgi:hypothetical protein
MQSLPKVSFPRLGFYSEEVKKKKIKKTAVLSAITLCLSLFGATGWILITPITSKAATFTASCGVAPDVTCTGSGECVATHGWGCKASNGDGCAPMIQLCQVY